MYSTENWHSIYQSIAVAYYFSGLSYCALLHNTRVCKRNEYYFGGSRELRFSCSYEATVTKTHCLRRFSLISRSKNPVLFFGQDSRWFCCLISADRGNTVTCLVRQKIWRHVSMKFLEKGSFDSISHIYQDSAKYIFVCSLLQFTALAFRHRARDNCSQLYVGILFSINNTPEQQACLP